MQGPDLACQSASSGPSEQNAHGALNRPGLSGDSVWWDRPKAECRCWSVVDLFKLDWWDVSVLFVEPGVVEPVDVVQGRDLDLLDGLPELVGIDQLGLVQHHNGLRDGVVIGVQDRCRLTEKPLSRRGVRSTLSTCIAYRPSFPRHRQLTVNAAGCREVRK